MKQRLYLTRPRVVVLGVIATVLVTGFVVGWHYGPYHESRQACSFCGQGRVQQWRLGMTTGPSETPETTWTRWVRELHPEHEHHTWTGIGFTGRGWFGLTRIGCGGSGIPAFYRLRQDVGEQEAQQRLAVYHDVIERDARRGLIYAVGISDLIWAYRDSAITESRMRELLDRFDNTLESPDERAAHDWRRSAQDEIDRQSN